MINVGIVGCGRIIEEGHAPAFAKLTDRFRVVAVADTSAARRDLIADRFGVPPGRRYSDWQELLALTDVDLVDMALPHFLHLPSLRAAAAAGKAVLMEKPMATSLDEADAIMAAVADFRAAGLHHSQLSLAARGPARVRADPGRGDRPAASVSEARGSPPRTTPAPPATIPTGAPNRAAAAGASSSTTPITTATCPRRC